MLYPLKEGKEVRHGSEEEDDGKDNHHGTDNLIDDADATLVEDGASLVNQPSQSIPPQQGTAYNTGKAHQHLDGTVGNDKGKLGKKTHEKENDKRIGERH